MNGRWPLVFLGVAILVAAVVFGVGTAHRDSKVVATCADLEGVKAALRDDENANWALLPTNLKLLKITPTKPLMKRLRTEHQRKLARFASRPC